MKLFIRGLPDGTAPADLRQFAEQLLAPAWYRPFAPKAAVKSCTVLKIRDLDANTVEFHGLLEVQPAMAALQAVKTLDGKRFHGRSIAVRKWQIRSELNDPRKRSGTAEEGPAAERRRGDRRRTKLLIETYTPPQFEAVKSFHRVYGK